MEVFKYEIGQEEINALPVGWFEGTIHIPDSREEAEKLTAGLADAAIIGFDTESRPSFTSGEHYPISLIQVATETEAWIFRLKVCGIPKTLSKVFADINVTKVGLGLQSDLAELKKKGIEIANYVDLEKIAGAHKFKQRGIRALSAYFLRIRISKSAQKSNWARPDLSQHQIRYAATDPWACLRIFQEMKNQGFIRNIFKEEE